MSEGGRGMLPIGSVKIGMQRSLVPLGLVVIHRKIDQSAHSLLINEASPS
jgi:hypothetical protein